MTERPYLLQLADRCGIIPEYTDCSAAQRITSDATREMLLAAMGYDAADEAAAQHALADLDRQQQQQLFEPVRVLSEESDNPRSVNFQIPEDLSGNLDWRIEFISEDGQQHSQHGQVNLGSVSRDVEVKLDIQPDTGYHTVRVSLRSSSQERNGEQAFIVTPQACLGPADIFGDRRIFGIWANLYTVCSQENWGGGNFSDLRELLSLANDSGAGFVGMNPLHVHRNSGLDISPYRPVSRFFRNVLYLDVTAVPELADCDQAKSLLESSRLAEQLRELQKADLVDYAAIASLQRPILDALHRTFIQKHRHKSTDRGLAYAEYVSRQGIVLQHFATFQALEEHLKSTGIAAGDWKTWPAAYGDPNSAQTEEFRREHRDLIDLYCYLQFELDQQLASAAQHAQAAGMPVGLYQDLAIGTAPEGRELWAYPELFVSGASVGAPPDPLGPTGQDWALPPVHPQRLIEGGYWYWIQLLNSALDHAGALRIDHVMGLSRQFWVPVGHLPQDGAYVRYPADDLFGILALESHRHGALIVGEDLGTVPHGFREMLQSRGVLSNQVMYFERDWQGEFLPSSNYSPRALVTVNTHDLVPLAGFAQGRDFLLRQELGEFKSDEQFAEAQQARAEAWQALLRRLTEEGLLNGTLEPSPSELRDAVHIFLSRTSAPLVGLSLDDLAGETEPVNLPGVMPDKFSSWSRRMRTGLKELFSQSDLPRIMEERGRK